MASERFLVNKKRQPLREYHMGDPAYIYGLRVAGKLGFALEDIDLGMPVVLRDHEQLILQQRNGRLTLYRMI